MRIIATLAITLATAMPAAATPFEVMNPNELLVVVPNLEHVGYSRISTVEFCAQMTNTQDWTNLMTDAEFEVMEACLIEHT